MYQIYKALRDADYMAAMGEERASIPRAIYEAIDIAFRMRRFCTLGVHLTLDVWDGRCWHERLNDKIERLEAKQVWGNPNIEWAPYEEYHIDEFVPVTEVDEAWGWQEDGTYIPSPALREAEELVRKGGRIDYHPWRQ